MPSQGQKFGGVGPGVSPKQALELGLKVDMEAVPKDVAAAIKAGKVDSTIPANTLLLLKANAVVGVTGFFAQDGKSLRAVGIQCALCHSTVDDAFAKGIGRRLDGWPNHDLNIGAIVATAPDLSAFAQMLQVDEATVKKVLTIWGPGKFDAVLNLDGKAFRPDGKPAATLNPPAFGLAGVNNHTWTGAWGTVSYWNAYVGNLEMHGSGNFYDPRFDDAVKYPVAARTKQGHIENKNDRITAKLPALHFYQLALPVPKPPAGSFDRAAADAGKTVFEGKARCAGCHVPPLFTEPGWNLHKAEDIGIDDFQAKRSPDERYRTTPLRALWDMEKIAQGRVLSRRPLRHARRRDQSLRRPLQAEPERAGKAQSHGVSKVALVRATDCDGARKIVEVGVDIGPSGERAGDDVGGDPRVGDAVSAVAERHPAIRQSAAPARFSAGRWRSGRTIRSRRTRPWCPGRGAGGRACACSVLVLRGSSASRLRSSENSSSSPPQITRPSGVVRT